MLHQNADLEGIFIIAIVAARDDITISDGGEVAAIRAENRTKSPSRSVVGGSGG